jgi:hypothetical protein
MVVVCGEALIDVIQNADGSKRTGLDAPPRRVGGRVQVSVGRKQIEDARPVPKIRKALRALDEAALQSRLDLRRQAAAAEKRVDRF